MRAGVFLFLCLASPALAQTAPAGDHAPVPKPPLHICSDSVLKTIDSPVTLGFRITPEGTVGDVAVLQSSGSDSADQAAQSCVKTWTYEPAQRDGAAIEWQAHVTLHSEKVARTGDGRQDAAMTNVTPEIAKALDHFIHDMQGRCQVLYKTDARYGDRQRARNRVVVKRLADGHTDIAISQSSPVHGADDGARACAAYLIGKHDDLPLVFTVEIEIDWARYYDTGERGEHSRRR